MLQVISSTNLTNSGLALAVSGLSSPKNTSKAMMDAERWHAPRLATA